MRYIITVNDNIRSAQLSDEVARNPDSYRLVPAVTPDELPDNIDLRNARPGFSRSTYLSKMEYCCVMSHVRALAMMIKDNPASALIMEDDITLSENMPRLSNYMNGNTIIIIGCQQGMKFERYFQLRSAVTQHKLMPFELRVIYRAACYMLDGRTAKKLHTLYSQNPKCVADDWLYISRTTGMDIRFFNGASHPRDMSGSYLHASRHGKTHQK